MMWHMKGRTSRRSGGSIKKYASVELSRFFVSHCRRRLLLLYEKYAICIELDVD